MTRPTAPTRAVSSTACFGRSPSAHDRSRWRDEDGLLATPVLFVIWSGLLVAIAVIDVGAYLVAAGRAQAAADAAALAAVGLDIEPAGTPPLQAARVVAQRNGGEVESCACRLGSGRAEVRVSVAVHGLFVPRVTGAQRVTAVARAELAALVVGRASRSPPAFSGRVDDPGVTGRSRATSS